MNNYSLKFDSEVDEYFIRQLEARFKIEEELPVDCYDKAFIYAVFEQGRVMLAKQRSTYIQKEEKLYQDYELIEHKNQLIEKLIELTIRDAVCKKNYQEHINKQKLEVDKLIIILDKEVKNIQERHK